MVARSAEPVDESLSGGVGGLRLSKRAYAFKKYFRMQIHSSVAHD